MLTFRAVLTKLRETAREPPTRVGHSFRNFLSPRNHCQASPQRDSRFSRFLLNFHFSFSISSHLSFTFNSRKRVKGIYFSLFTSRKKVKAISISLFFLQKKE